LSEGLPEFVVVGHVCQDLLPDGRLSLGGSVSYAATTALRLGYRVGIVTSAGPDLELGQALPDVEIVYRRAERTTLFENIYHNGQRTQILHQRAHVLTCEDIPPDWRPAPMVYVGSIDQEIDEGIFQCFSAGSLIGVMPQGMFRRWDEAGRVYFAEWNPRPKVLQRINLLVISELDVPDPCRRAAEWARMADIVVVTHAERGATVYQAGEVRHYPPRPALEVDPTGAGDVFAAAFLIRMAETRDAEEAAAFANVVASFSIEGPGVAGIPWRECVEDYLRATA
jgi:1D-myo-inositol 3-kinase